MRVLVTGANGFLGNYLIQELIKRKHEVIATGKGNCRIKANDTFVYEEMDFTEVQSVKNVFSTYKPGVVVHAGAMSKPDECEDNRELAFNVNTQGTINLLAAAKSVNSFFIFISTDFVFDGLKGMYKEDDIPAPVNYYGQTKLLAESVISKDLSYFKTEAFGFYLQDAYVKDWIDNTMVFMEVEDVTHFWNELLALDLTSKFEGVRLEPVRTLDWGRECFIHDPSGILWHVGEFFK